MFIKLKLILLSIVLLCAIFSESVAQESNASNSLKETGKTLSQILFEKVAPATVMITTEENNGDESCASGFLISSSGYIVTCNHVVANVSDILVKFHSGETIKVDGLYYTDVEHDLAIIKIAGAMYPSLKVASKIPSPGADVFSFGNSQCTGITIGQGLISSPYDNVKKILKFNAPASQGNSGGPLVDENGEVVGIISFKNVEGELLNYAYTATLLNTIDVTSLKPVTFEEVQKKEDESATIVMVLPFDSKITDVLPYTLGKNTSEYEELMVELETNLKDRLLEQWSDENSELLFIDYLKGQSMLAQSDDLYTSKSSQENIRIVTNADYLIEGEMEIRVDQSSKNVFQIGGWRWKVETKFYHDDQIHILMWDEIKKQYCQTKSVTIFDEIYNTNGKYLSNYYTEVSARNAALNESVSKFGTDIKTYYINKLKLAFNQLTVTDFVQD